MLPWLRVLPRRVFASVPLVIFSFVLWSKFSPLVSALGRLICRRRRFLFPSAIVRPFPTCPRGKNELSNATSAYLGDLLRVCENLSLFLSPLKSPLFRVPFLLFPFLFEPQFLLVYPECFLCFCLFFRLFPFTFRLFLFLFFEQSFQCRRWRSFARFSFRLFFLFSALFAFLFLFACVVFVL